MDSYPPSSLGNLQQHSPVALDPPFPTPQRPISEESLHRPNPTRLYSTPYLERIELIKHGEAERFYEERSAQRSMQFRNMPNNMRLLASPSSSYLKRRREGDILPPDLA